jgi:Na+-transporting NADH:ubiquinone oxidoreductase subunit D
MAETTVKETQKAAEPLFPFGKKERQLITDPLNDNNPITVQVLGICSALAVTSLVYPSVVMAVAVVFRMCVFQLDLPRYCETISPSRCV